MRVSSRLAITGATTALAIGGLFAAPGHAGTSASALEQPAAVAPAELSAASSGSYHCAFDLARCKSQRAYYQYLGCTVSPIYADWYNMYYFKYWC